MSTTRRGFLKMLGIGSVAGPTIMKVAIKAPVIETREVVMTSGSSFIGYSQPFDPKAYVGEVEYETVSDTPSQWWSMVRGYYPPSQDKKPVRYQT